MANKNVNESEVLKTALAEYEKLNSMVVENSTKIFSELVKEEVSKKITDSINEEDEDEEMDTEEVDTEEVDTEETLDTEEEIEDETEDEIADAEAEDISDVDNLPMEDYEETESEEVQPEVGDEEGSIDYEVEDLTDASSDDVIKVFKALKDEDEIEVVSDNEVKITDPESGNEYKVVMGSKTEDIDVSVEDEEDVEIVYEVVLDETDEEVVKEEEGCTYTEEEDMVFEVEIEEGEETIEEQIPVSKAQAYRQKGVKANIGQPKGAGAKAIEESKKLKVKYNSLLTESKKVSEENQILKEALKDIRGKISEHAVFNQNLTNVVKLFLEHSTSIREKKSILKKFDNDAKTINESKKLYKTITNEFKEKKTISESLEDKLSKDSRNSSTSKTVLVESKTGYADSGLQKSLSLMHRIKR